MKNLSLASLFLFVIFSFSPSKGEVKVIESFSEVEAILRKDKVLINKISCQSVIDNFCALVLDGTDLMVDCPCEGYSLKQEPNLKELTEWNYKEKMKVMAYAHNHFKNTVFHISHIKILKIEKRVYLFVQLLEKHKNNRVLFTIEN